MRATAAHSVLAVTAVPLSEGGRRKRVPAFELVPPQTPSERLLDRLLVGEETDRFGRTQVRTLRGIHHVTAISGKPTRNLDFYARTLGLRFVKKTVNFDDPGTYHFYYGDEAGSPGTILTFFPWEHASAGRGGLGLAQTTAFSVPAASIGYWTTRLIEKGVKDEALGRRSVCETLPVAVRTG